MIAALQNLRTAPAAVPPQAMAPLKVAMQSQAAVADKMPEHFQFAEIKRITSLPVMKPMTPEEIEAFSRERIQAQYFDKGFRFFDAQADALANYEMFGGVFGPIGVGWGKTAISLLCAKAALSKGLTKMLLIMPPEVLGQLIETDIPWCRNRFGLNYPIHILGGRSMEYRKSLCLSGYKGLYILPFSLLQTKDTSENLKAIAPQLVIVDEVHRLANLKAARTRRVIEMLEMYHPELVVLSGTITKHSIMDYWHLIRHALKDNNPLPNAKGLAQDWSLLIDAEASTENGQQTGPVSKAPIIPLVSWALKNFPDTIGGFTDDVYGFRRAFNCRLNSAPGVVATGDAEIGTSILIRNEIVPSEKHTQWPALKKLIDGVTDDWRTPNGDEIEHAIHKWKWLNELSCGFYNELTWAEPEAFAERRKIPVPEAKDILDRAILQHLTQQEYAKKLRTWLETYAKAGMDTPMLVGLEMARNGPRNVGHDLYGAWKDAKDLVFDGMPERDSRAVRVCDYKITAFVAWAKGLKAEFPNKGAICWVHHQEIGRWAVDALAKVAGIAAIHCPAGENERILDPANADKIVVASMTAHGTGKNLQHFQHQYFLQWPRDARAAEQTLGRTHRNGQLADELVIHTNRTLPFDDIQFAACLNNSLYIHQTTGNRQKLIYSAYDPNPKIFPPAVLIQKGIDDVADLNKEQRQLLVDKFGEYATV